jgi:hypothetical protein
MADIFDRLAAKKEPDIFDRLAAQPVEQPMGPRRDVFDRLAEEPRQEPAEPEGPNKFIKTGKAIGGQLAGTAEAAMSLSSGVLLWPFSKVYGLMALPFGAEAAKMAEESIQSLGYQPHTKEGRAAVELVSKGMEVFLTPTTIATEEMEKYSPRAAYLTQLGGELVQFGIAGAGFGGGKVKIAEVRGRRAIRKAQRQGLRAMDLVKKRVIDIDKSLIDSELFVRDLTKDLSVQELEALSYIRQKIKDPEVLKKIGREDLIPIVEKPSPKLLKADKRVENYYAEAHEFLKDTWGDDIGFVEHYVNQIWDIPKNRQSEVVSYFATKNPFLKKRKIPTLEEGIGLGLEPRTTNIADLLRIYDQYKIKTAANMKAAEGFKNMVDAEGNPMMLRTDKAPPDWVEIQHPALSRAMMVGKVGKEGVMLRKVPVKVHPDIAPEAKIIFGEPFSGRAVAALEFTNAIAKKSMLTLSLFHHFALTEAAFSSGVGIKAVKQFNPYKMYKEIKSGNFEVFKNSELAKDFIEHEGKLGAIADVQRGHVQKALQNLEHMSRKTAGAKQATKFIRKANDLWDTALWDYYHNNLKLLSYEHQVAAEIRRLKPQTPQEVTRIKTEIANFVNDSFGGQHWEFNRMLGHPKMVQIMHWGILAPDWTVSTLKQAGAPFRGTQRSMARRGKLFWVKAALYFNLVAQSINLYNTQKYKGDARYTWENTPGHELNIYFGQNPDRTERYIRLGKQFREVMEWVKEPEKKVGAKLSPAARLLARQVAKHDPGSGFPTEYAEQDFWESVLPVIIDKHGKLKVQVPERLKDVPQMFVPFSLRPYLEDRPKMFMFSLPGSRGMTNYRAVKGFKAALNKNDADKVARIYVGAYENDLDAPVLLKRAKSAVKSDITYDDKMLAMGILKEMNQLGGNLDDKAVIDLLVVYDKRGVLTPGVRKQLVRLMKKQKKVKRSKELLGIGR